MGQYLGGAGKVGWKREERERVLILLFYAHPALPNFLQGLLFVAVFCSLNMTCIGVSFCYLSG